MNTVTQTRTFTVVDIRRVVENFAADLYMISQATGVGTRDEVNSLVSDLRIFAELSYVVEISLVLQNAQGAQIRAAKYIVSTSATGWVNDRPGANLWPRLSNARLSVIVTFTDAWYALTEQQQRTIRERNGIEGSWDESSTDTSFRHLSAAVDRRYASNGYGMERTSYQ